MKTLSRPTNLSAQVYQAVADEIVSGRLEAGMHLRQEELAARLGVSRQPVQQAMVMLSLDGLVIKSDKRGLYVAPLDAELMQKHYDIRCALDGLAARQAAQKLSVDTFLVSSEQKSWARIFWQKAEQPFPKLILLLRLLSTRRSTI